MTISESPIYRLMQPGEEPLVSDLVVRIFNDFVAPDYDQAGIDAFMAYVTPLALTIRFKSGHIFLLATLADQIVGMIELRPPAHIALLFVDRSFQRRGIGRSLVHQVIKLCRNQQPELNQISVYASPYAVPIYMRLGFQAQDAELVQDGIRFVPMVLRLVD